MSIHLVQRDSPADHDDLGAVQQLRDLQGEAVIVLVLGGDPDLPRLLEQLLALRMHPGVERIHGAGAGRSGGGPVGEFREQGIEFHDGPRNWHWWTKGQDLYTENFERAGFVKIPTTEATQRGDVVLMNFNYTVPMHGAVVVDRDLLLHHAAGTRAVDATRLSAAVPRTRYARHINAALRRA